jgi:hypothetical protein
MVRKAPASWSLFLDAVGMVPPEFSNGSPSIALQKIEEGAKG